MYGDGGGGGGRLKDIALGYKCRMILITLRRCNRNFMIVQARRTFYKSPCTKNITISLIRVQSI